MNHRLPLAKAAMLLGSIVCSLAVLYAACLLTTGHGPLGFARSRFTDDPTRIIPTGLWRDDLRLGYAHVPLATGRHRKRDFDVVYSIDATGCRVTPEPATARGVVLVLGDSFTFGHGVADAEAYPAVLGARHWPGYKVRNCAGMGWGTGQAALVADDALAGTPRPALVLYGWIWPDSQRNYLRASWLKLQHRFKRRTVHFDLVGDRLRYMGTAGPELALDDNAPQLAAKERQVTLALIRHMADAASRASAALYVVLLPYGDPKIPVAVNDDLVALMRRSRIGFIDLRTLESRTLPGPLSLDGSAFFPTDGHPRPAWHVAVAATIAAKVPLE